MIRYFFTFFSLFSKSCLCLTLTHGCNELLNANLRDSDTSLFISEVLKNHLMQNNLSEKFLLEITGEIFNILDPQKNIFLKSEVEHWTNKKIQAKIFNEVSKGQFNSFRTIVQLYCSALSRRNSIIEGAEKMLPAAIGCFRKQFTDHWPSNLEELKCRSELLNTDQSFDANVDATSHQFRCATLPKRILNGPKMIHMSSNELISFSCAIFLRAFGNCLDVHSSYLTPFQLKQMSMGIQQSFKGVGLRLNAVDEGLEIVQLISSSPAEKCGQLRSGDVIIAIDDVSVIGLTIDEAAERIRGPAGTEISISVIKPGGASQQPLKIQLKRETVVVQEGRIETAVQSIDDLLVGHVKLYSFYEDDRTCSASDLNFTLRELQGDPSKPLAAVVLDLRENAGGLLTQAVEVAGQFLKRCIVVSIKDSNENVFHVRNLNASPAWNGPLIVLTSRASASGAEIVAQCLQDFGRAIVVGDDRTFGKGTFQTLSIDHKNINPKGAFKVTRGRYYTPSGKSPQKIGVRADIAVPGPLNFLPIGEVFAKRCIDSDHIHSAYHYPACDLPFGQRELLKRIYGEDLQLRSEFISIYIAQLRKNSEQRMLDNAVYREYLTAIPGQSLHGALFAKPHDTSRALESLNELQLREALDIARDLAIIHRQHSEAAQP